MTKARLIFILLMAVLSSGLLCAQNDSRARKERLQKEIALLESQIKANAGKNTDALASLSLVRKSISSREALLRESEAQLAAINDSISYIGAKADSLQQRLDTMEYYYNRLIRNAYKNRDTRMWYMHILASDNIAQGVRRFNYLRTLSKRMNSQARSMSSLKSQLDSQLVQLNVLRAMAEQLSEERRADIESLRAEEQRANSLVDNLQKEKKKYQKQLKQKQRQMEALNREIEKLIASEMKPKKSKSSSKKVSSTVDTKLSGEFASNKGKLPWPCDGSIIDHFGQRNHPIYTSITMPFNNGVNLAVREGTQVMAIFDGVVKKVIMMPGYNKCVLVQHGDYFSFYCKLASVNVKAGAKVSRGQVLGVVDTIDGQTQLHLQIWKGSKPQDPEIWLKKD